MSIHVLHISSTDVAGGRFNGYAMLQSGIHNDCQHEMAVWHKTSDSPWVHELRQGNVRFLNALSIRITNLLGLDGWLSPAGFTITAQPYFRRADLVHLQVIHSGSFFSLASLPRLDRLKPIVWTVHDAWPTTGMCIHSFECERWLTGCQGRCPHPRGNSLLRYYTPAIQWRWKQKIYRELDVTLVVASQWTLKRVQQSPLLNRLPCELIPFGINLSVFLPRPKTVCRTELGIPENCDVVAFRAGDVSKDTFKGLVWLKEALMEYEPQRPTCLLYFDEGKDFDALQGKYILRDMGYIRDETILAKILSAADIFLMPSLQESFGVMAIEAMACGTPVIVADGTSLPDVIHAPLGGLVVPAKNSTALVGAISQLLDNEEMRHQLGFQARRIAEQEYSFDLYASRHLKLYENVISNNRESIS
ncbi:MAG: glycosyltransferase [Anaerolineales bacterium]